MKTPLKAIREKCIDCCCGNMAEVNRCALEKCALHPYRFGKNPNRAGIGGGIVNLHREPSTQNLDPEGNSVSEGKDMS